MTTFIALKVKFLYIKMRSRILNFCYKKKNNNYNCEKWKAAKGNVTLISSPSLSTFIHT